MYGEKSVGSIPHFGAIEEKICRGFHGCSRMKKRIHDEQFRLGNGLLSAGTKCDRANLIEWAAGISTEGAQEMQNREYRVASNEYRAISSQFSVLSSQFSVRGGRCGSNGCLFVLVCFSCSNFNAARLGCGCSFESQVSSFRLQASQLALQTTITVGHSGTRAGRGSQILLEPC